MFISFFFQFLYLLINTAVRQVKMMNVKRVGSREEWGENNTVSNLSVCVCVCVVEMLDARW
uniref:Uncharacterized protein n=1 Tax=Octopus bimaculoides TaxID=37653 RepID=A0A0L8I2J4_OCTBM